MLPGWGGMAVLDRSWYGRARVKVVESVVGAIEAALAARNLPVPSASQDAGPPGRRRPDR